MEAEVKTGPGRGKITQLKYSDYQEVPNSNGLIMAFTLSQGEKGGPSQPLNVTAVEINPKVDNATFQFPAEK